MVTIPAQHREALRSIAQMDSKLCDQLVDAIRAARVSESGLRAAVNSVALDPVAFDALMSSAVFRSSHGLSPVAAAEQFAEVLGLGDAATQLAKVLAEPNLVLVAKALDLQSTYERVLHVSRIMTDLRPVFSDDDTVPLAGTIAHQLQVITFEQSGIHDFFIAMDDADLKVLRDQVDRALQKSENLREAVSGTSLAVVKEDE
ncbi:hypothetical protein [Aeromicrobium marinum]|uniref:hypothetical protein n=1 Tax=Aeromicrobium marinum TaxID=219314 RepID=UPI0001BCD94B|nr:hypothetical protein [Aeromicrobium marinum]